MKCQWLLLILCSIFCRGQVLVSMDLLPVSGTSPEVGKGLGASTLNIHVCGVGNSKPVPYDVVRMQFQEYRPYSNTQANLILSTRISKSLPARILQYSGYSTAAVGIGVTVEQKLTKSPSWLGPGLAAAGLAVPAIQALVTKQVPNYSIPNLPPDIFSFALNTCGDFTTLSPQTVIPFGIPARRVDPLN